LRKQQRQKEVSMKRRFGLFLVVAVVLGMSTIPAQAFLGIGDIVFDPSNYIEAVQSLLQLEQQYQQLVATYQQVRGQYEHLKRMAQQVPVNMAARYRSATSPWRNLSAQNVYGTSGGWVSASNSGVSAAAAYQQATTTLENYGSAFANIPANQQQGVKTAFANVELADGANVLGMETIGQLRANAARMEGTIGALEQDSLSADPAMNTEIAVLNKLNAASMVGIRSTQDTNKVLVNLAEQQLLEAKRIRDAEARAINADVRFRTEAKAELDAQAAEASKSMLAWRLP
jgi:hypothetical protein